MTEESREMTLAEVVDRLPPGHRARAEYNDLVEKARLAQKFREYRYKCHECMSPLVWEEDGIMVSCTNPDCHIRFMGTK